MGPEDRRTTRLVQSLAPGEIFVFGANERGAHGRGAAAQARRFGAKTGVGVGLCGQTYAIPTKPADVRKRLSLGAIGKYVEAFVRFAAVHPGMTFLVTEIGCGLAGYAPAEIAPLFRGCVDLDNVHLPARFWQVLAARLPHERTP